MTDSTINRAPAPGQGYLVFEGAFPTDPGWIGDEPDPDKPAGRDVIELLLTAVDASLPQAEIWNEEGFGWAFNCKIGRITVNVLVQYVDHWLVIVHEVSLLPAFLRSKRYERAVLEVCERIHRTLTSTAQVTRVRWLNETEYGALPATGSVF